MASTERTSSVKTGLRNISTLNRSVFGSSRSHFQRIVSVFLHYRCRLCVMVCGQGCRKWCVFAENCNLHVGRSSSMFPATSITIQASASEHSKHAIRITVQMCFQDSIDLNLTEQGDQNLVSATLLSVNFSCLKKACLPVDFLMSSILSS